MTDASASIDFDRRIAANADRITVRVVCTHAGKGFDGGPIVLVAFLDDGSVIPDYRYWREDMSEVGGRLEAIAQARGGTPKTPRLGKPRLRQILECACGTGFPFASEDINALVDVSGAAGQRFLELSAIPGLIHALRDTP